MPDVTPPSWGMQLRDPLFFEAACTECGQRIWHAAVNNILYCFCKDGPSIRPQDRTEVRQGLHHRRRQTLNRLEEDAGDELNLHGM